MTSDRTPVPRRPDRPDRPDRSGPPRRLLGAAACACLVVAWSAGATLPAQARSGSAPELSITVDNGQSTVAPGDGLVYTITVTNLGADRVRKLRLSQSVPQGARLVTTGADAVVKGGTVRWTLDVPATRQVTVRTTLRVSDPAPPDLLRLAVVACAALKNDGPPLVCATDSDQLPAGAAAQQRQAAPVGAAPTHRSWWPYAGGGALLAGGVAGGLAIRRRRRRRLAAVAPVAQRAELTDVR